MNIGEIERRLAELLANAGGWLSGPELDDMRSLNNAGEPGVALENFCTQLYEYDVSVPRDVLDEISILGRAMGLSEEYWEGLSWK